MSGASKLGIIAAAVFVLGCLCDHLTTTYGLMLPFIDELNMNVIILMRNGLWHVVEMLIVAAGIASGLLASRSRSGAVVGLSASLLLSGGLFRFFAGIQNLMLMLKVMS